MASHEELGSLLREARLGKGMSLGQLASAVGRSSSSVRRWERGEVVPAATVLPKLSAILEIDQELIDASKPELPAEEPTDSDVDDGEERASTVEQPVVEVASPTPTSIDRYEAPPESSSGFLGDLWARLVGGHRTWIGLIRGLLTAALLLVMLFVLIWAVGELWEALGDVVDTFDSGSSGDA